ncbi:hypothetical protein V7122_19385 [Bacillus sp. JJ1532]|uniref:hypothetical protein n=1 Tax=Bacillus sp. JJ1532 TaxID=3122958 RepID=UPI002FFD7587
MSMYKNLIDIVRVFYHDEPLLRLLHYKPEDMAQRRLDPLDKSLANILDIDKDWVIRDKVFKLVPKSSNLEDEPICRIYLYAGRRERASGNYLHANQMVVVDILCHIDYEKDLRSCRIGDRINELIVDSNVTGFGKIRYVEGMPFAAPEDYVGYRHFYEVGNFTK